MSVHLVARAAQSLATTILVVLVVSAAAVLAGIALKLTVAGSIALYFVVWWTVLFAILPIAVRTQSDIGEVVAGTDPGAPAAPELRQRAIWTTLVSVGVFLLVAGLFDLAGL